MHLTTPLADVIVLLSRALICREPSRITKQCAKFRKHFTGLIFTVRDEATKTARIMCLENLALYDI